MTLCIGPTATLAAYVFSTVVVVTVYLEADVRRNRRKEAGREVNLPWFQEEGSQLSQLEGTGSFLRYLDHLS